MEVSFRRTGERRYGISVKREGFPDVEMNPAPGYDSRLPHDLVHFVVESELGLPLGVYGQLARGGHAGSFRKYGASLGGAREARRQRRRDEKRAERLSEEGHEDAVFSEHAAVICMHHWLLRSEAAEDRREAQARAPYARKLLGELPPERAMMLGDGVVDSICARFEALSQEWRRLGVGDELTVSWSG